MPRGVYDRSKIKASRGKSTVRTLKPEGFTPVIVRTPVSREQLRFARTHDKARISPRDEAMEQLKRENESLRAQLRAARDESAEIAKDALRLLANGMR